MDENRSDDVFRTVERAGTTTPPEAPMGVFDMVRLLANHWLLMLGGSLGAGVIAIGVTFIVKPIYTARTTFLPPQQQQSSAAAALASLGGLSSLAGSIGGAALRTPADQYVALLESERVTNALVDRFKFVDVYDATYHVDARKKLASNSHIAAGKKDGIITVEFDDTDPKRAAAVANQYVAELRTLTSTLALTEAQQRRVFFEGQLASTRDRLANAQAALQASGFSEGALRAEPKAAAEAYARLKAETTAVEVRLQALRGSYTDNSPEVQSQTAILSGLRAHLARLESSMSQDKQSPDYVTKYREFKYQEALFELYARQFESARLDESKEGSLIQVIDMASPPERRSRPKRGLTAIVTTAIAFLLLASWVLIGSAWRRSKVMR